MTRELDQSASPVVGKPQAVGRELTLADVAIRTSVEFVRFELPHGQMELLLERGVLPGCLLCPIRHSPFGDPIVTVNGSLLALRREVAECLCVRLLADAVPDEPQGNGHSSQGS
jgi:Fe2+ transport system protein FeoA